MKIQSSPPIELKRQHLAVQKFFKGLPEKTTAVMGTGDQAWIVSPALKLASGEKAKRIAKALAKSHIMPIEIL